MEFWDIVDRHGKPTGKKICRGKLNLKHGEYHRVVHVWVFFNNKFLIQKRSLNKMPMPGEWAATGGSVISGETPVAAACRELSEELSISAEPEQLSHVAHMVRKNSILDIYSLHINVDANSLDLQESEVESVKWVTNSQLRQMIKDGEFHNYGFEYFNYIFPLVK